MFHLSPVWTPPIPALGWYSSPISNIGFFVLGMAPVKYGVYPKIIQIRHVSFLADLSFYVYLIHFPLVIFWTDNFLIGWIATLYLSLALMWIDGKIQKLIGKFMFIKLDLSRLKAMPR